MHAVEHPRCFIFWPPVHYTAQISEQYNPCQIISYDVLFSYYICYDLNLKLLKIYECVIKQGQVALYSM